MKPSTALSALLFACFVNLASAADDHKGHAHNDKPGQPHRPSGSEAEISRHIRVR